MTKKKKRALEQARLEEEQRRKSYGNQPAHNARVMYGPVNGESGRALPVINGGYVGGVELPPIIQPISLRPYLSELDLKNTNNEKSNDDFEDEDDFDDDFDDMF